MNDQLGRTIDSWLKATDPPAGDVGRAVASIEAEFAATPQRGRWWPLPVPSRRLTGPERPRGQTMFSALKLFAAGAIVALFSGLLFAGFALSPQEDEAPAAIATASDSPEPATESPADPLTSTAAPEVATDTAPTTEIRSDLVRGVELLAEEDEPGVFRIVNDGVRDLSLPVPGPGGFMYHVWVSHEDRLLTGLDGSVWLRVDDGLTRLGDRRSRALPSDPGRVDVSREGTLWAVGEGPRLSSDDGSGWQARLKGRDLAKTIAFRMTSDDDVWALLGTDRAGRYRLRHYDGTEWTKLPRPPAPADLPEARLEAWAVGDDRTSWAIRRGLISHFDGERWNAVGPYTRQPLAFRQLPDGGALSLRGSKYGRVAVDSFATDGSSERITIPAFGDWSPDAGEAIWTLAPDGAVWRSLVQAECAAGSGIFCIRNLIDCAGLARFDGETWTSHLPGRCVAEMDFGPDGSVWAYASTTTPGETMTAGSGLGVPPGTEIQTLVPGPLELYVVTPEAVAG